MYEEFFNFSAAPFKLNPDPKFFFGSRSHNKAMAYLHYGLRQAEGFIVITGEIGAGKSIMIGHLLDQLDRSNVIAAHLLTPNLKPDDLISHILSAFRVEPANDGTTAEIEAFEDFLFDQLNRGRRVLLIVDEAQNLPKETLEELRILSNMDYDGTPLFQVFLVGQPDFRPVLAGPGMEQLRQRIIASYHLQPLNREETQQYIEHRLSVVGWTDEPDFTEEAFDKIFDATGGVPRKINKLSNRLLLSCSMDERTTIDGPHATSVIDDLASEDLSVEPAEAVDAAGFADYPPNLNQDDSGIDELEAEAVNSDRWSSDGEEAGAGDTDTDERVRVIVPFAPITKVEEETKVEAGLADSDEQDQTEINEKDAPLEAVANNDTAEGDVAMLDDIETADDEKNIEDNEVDAISDQPIAGESLLDSLKRQGKVKKKRAAAVASGQASATQPATIDDVANAIAAVGSADDDAQQTIVDLGDFDETPGSDSDVEKRVIGAIPAIDDDAKEWRKSIVKSVNETRNELKEAHSKVSRIRRQLADNDRRRSARKDQIIASIARAESLLTEIRNG